MVPRPQLVVRHSTVAPLLACTLWLVDAYVMIGRRADAVRLFERLLSLRNDLGLLSEQYEPRTRRLVGNFPQAFSHLALVNSASNLANDRKPAEQRSQSRVANNSLKIAPPT